MRPLRYALGFLIALLASTLVAVFTLEASTALQEGKGLQPSYDDILFISMFALPIVLVGAIAVGLPVYLYGGERGWFDTLAKSSATGAIAGTLFAAGVCLLITSPTLAGFLLFMAAGAIAGSIAGATWWAFAPPNQQGAR